jgi:aminoglycoside phosphotransferase (APT) family kinase protein
VSAPLDAARAARAGEELDAQKLEAFFAEHAPSVVKGPLEITQFPAGHSNLTYLVRGVSPDGAPVELVLRRPPFGNVVKTAHDMGREHRILSALAPVWPKAPRPVAYTEDTTVMGAPFYVMQRIRGVVLRRKLPEGMALEPPTLAKLGDAFVDTLVELHELDYAAIGLAELGKPEGYAERQVKGWTKRYLDAKTDDIPDVERAAAWLAEHIPVSPAPSLIHNDFKYDNLLLDPEDPTRIVGVLDWEMSTIGDPLMDLGTALAWWIEPTDPAPLQAFTFGPTNLPGSPTRAAIVERYTRARPSIPTDHLGFYYAFSLFKNAVVAQQIYARYVKGLTKDERFAAMIMGVRLLASASLEAIDRGGI